MSKGWLIGCGIAAVVGLFVGGVFALTQPVVDASEQFLDHLGRGQVAAAYADAADGFRAQMDEGAFARAVQTVGLTDYASASWHNRQINNNEGTAEGTVTTKGGDTRPVAVRLVVEGGQWKVVGLRYGGVDVTTVKAPPAVPPAAELERMAAEALLAFNRAVQAGDFTAFYGTLSELWKKQTTPEKLRATFREFIDKKIDIAPIRDLTPRFAPPPAVNEQGVLVVTGQYPTEPSRVRFELEYVREGGGWALMGITVRVGKGDAAAK
jgi:hypothetical protein